ncbi:hypothetical protein LCGC14_2055600 [marine sediment metagenome]|uniref:SCP2 domain-containing protein n=1 Tax=marine sediment metagenome TaxID=412755 RepID=A0A0F9EMV1_9ZZZZ
MSKLGVDINAIVQRFMLKVAEVADEEDFSETDGWLGKMVISSSDGEAGASETFVYEIREGKMRLTESAGPFVATMTMSRKTFLDIIHAALQGRGEEVFMTKYANRAISYDGGFWIIDSERFRKVFRRMAATKPGARR